MKIVIAMDSFKGSLSSMEAGNAAAEGIRRVYPGAEIAVRPLADGGEGTVEALTAGCGGRKIEVSVTGPLGEPVLCTYGMVEDSRTALIEMAGAAGITQVPEERRNPLVTTTYGVGEVIRDAINRGCRRFVIGIGGSATNDGGIGMLQALGFELLDEKGQQVPSGAKGLQMLRTIRTEHVLPELDSCTFRVACDVTNPLCGPEGCSAVFGPQKGADSAMIRDMDAWLLQYAKIAREENPAADPAFPGAGAAGGLGFAFRTFLQASLQSGIQIVLEETRLAEYIKDADFVLTGEGQLDAQTVMGKAPSGVARIAKEYRKPVLAFAGSVTPEAGICNQNGIDAFFPVLRRVSTLEEAMDSLQAARNMTDTVEQVFRVIKKMGK